MIGSRNSLSETHSITSQCASALLPKRLVPVRSDTQKKYLRFADARNNSSPVSCSTTHTGLPSIILQSLFLDLLDLGLTVTVRLICPPVHQGFQ